MLRAQVPKSVFAARIGYAEHRMGGLLDPSLMHVCVDRPEFRRRFQKPDGFAQIELPPGVPQTAPESIHELEVGRRIDRQAVIGHADVCREFDLQRPEEVRAPTQQGELVLLQLRAVGEIVRQLPGGHTPDDHPLQRRRLGLSR